MAIDRKNVLFALHSGSELKDDNAASESTFQLASSWLDLCLNHLMNRRYPDAFSMLAPLTAHICLPLWDLLPEPVVNI